MYDVKDYKSDSKINVWILFSVMISVSSHHPPYVNISTTNVNLENRESFGIFEKLEQGKDLTYRNIINRNLLFIRFSNGTFYVWNEQSKRYFLKLEGSHKKKWLIHENGKWIEEYSIVIHKSSSHSSRLPSDWTNCRAFYSSTISCVTRSSEVPSPSSPKSLSLYLSSDLRYFS